MSKYTYKTKDGAATGFIPGVGAIVDGKISSDDPIESPNLQLVSSPETANPPEAAPVVGIASQQNPNQPETAGSAPTNGVQA